MALLDPGAAEFWVLVAFIIFFAIVFYMKVPALLAGALDKRADAIRKELDEARLLREEAAPPLAGACAATAVTRIACSAAVRG